MIKKILVPLDGSPFGESILPFVMELSTALHAEVLLLHIEPHPVLADFGNETMRWQLHNRDAAGEAYLEAIREQFEKRTIECRSVVLEGRVVNSIIELVNEIDADLIAMATHGHSDLLGVFTSETATKVMRRSPVPVLMLNEALVQRTGRVAS